MDDMFDQLLVKFGLEPHHIRIVAPVIRRELGWLRLPGFLAKLALAPRPVIPVPNVPDEQEARALQLLLEQFAPMKPLFDALSDIKGRKAAEAVIGELLVELNIDWARRNYPEVKGLADFPAFVDVLKLDKVHDPKIAAQVETPAPGQAILSVPICYYQRALALLGLPEAGLAPCGAYEEYLRRHQPRVTATVARCATRGDCSCRIEYALTNR